MDLKTKNTTPQICKETGFIKYKGLNFQKEDILELIILLKDAISLSGKSKLRFSSLVINYEVRRDDGTTAVISEVDIKILELFYTENILNPNISSRNDG